MKRIGHLFDEVCAFDSLEQAACRALRANRESGGALRFHFDLEPRLLELQRQLLDGSYSPGPYRTFTIYEPKERRIAASPFRDRVVHHAVCAALEPVFERRYIFDSYGCRKDKGNQRAIARAQRFARGSRYFLKCDVRKYFESIDHAVLKAMLAGLFKDARLLDLLGRIVDHNAPHNAPGKGVPIGNLTSQHFSNLYLDRLDHFVKEDLRVKCYARYMDDFLCFADSKTELHETLSKVRAFLRHELQLELKERKCFVAPVSQGVPFLGLRIFPGTIRLSRPSLVRSRRKLKQREAAFTAGMLSEEEYIQSLGSLTAHLAQASTMALRRQWFAASPG
ncbi:MAG: hypothetical protein RLZZ303_328 [Candidatus Hydrogenedentota bacterium]|jgi:hypothetical protein